jgi:two-component system, OmpR family, alkaline phosphatase synthesis response regulator PhoP
MKKKILLVEDDMMLVDMYTLKFTEAGYEVIQATNGADGFEAAKTNKPDIILLDIILPQMDGFMVMEALKDDKKLKKIPVLFLTNLKQEEDVEKGNKLGAIDYLVKSTLTPTQILERIDKFFKNKK